MRTFPQCIPCFLRQVLSTAVRAGEDEAGQIGALRRAAVQLAEIPLSDNPAANTYRLLKPIYNLADCVDPYQSEKRRHNEAALELLPRLRALVREASDPLYAAAKVAVAGNIIDLGIMDEVDVERILDDLTSFSFAFSTSWVASSLFFLASSKSCLACSSALLDFSSPDFFSVFSLSVSNLLLA